jgi:hypothetical protein
MADIIPIALRYGITDERTWCMTYGELIAEIEANQKREQFLDLLNGKRCVIDASLHGIASCPADYMVTTTTTEETHMTPEEICDRAFRAFAGAGL